MKILYITTLPITYNTSANLRNIALINGFIKLGHEVHVLTTESNKNSVGYDSSLEKKINCTIHTIASNSVYKRFSSKKTDNRKQITHLAKTLLRKVYYSFKLTDSLTSSIRKFENNSLTKIGFDLVVSSSDFKSSHLLAEKYMKTVKKTNTKWIQYWGDPLLIDINNKSKLPNFIIKRFESKLIEKADRIVYVSPLTLNAQKKIYKKHSNKMRFLPIPYDEKFTMEPKSNVRRKGKLKIGYFGDFFSNNRDILPIYNAAKKLDVELEIYGNSDILLIPTKNIKINSRVNFTEVNRLENNCDILICISNQYGTQLPGKIYHYAAGNKKILILTENSSKEIEKYLSEYDKEGKYIFINNNEESIINKLEELMHTENLSSPPIENFKNKIIAEKFLFEI